MYLDSKKAHNDGGAYLKKSSIVLISVIQHPFLGDFKGSMSKFNLFN